MIGRDQQWLTPRQNLVKKKRLKTRENMCEVRKLQKSCKSMAFLQEGIILLKLVNSSKRLNRLYSKIVKRIILFRAVKMRSNSTLSRKAAASLPQIQNKKIPAKNFKEAALSSSKRMKTLIRNCRIFRSCERKLTKIIVGLIK